MRRNRTRWRAKISLSAPLSPARARPIRGTESVELLSTRVPTREYRRSGAVSGQGEADFGPSLSRHVGKLREIVQRGGVGEVALAPSSAYFSQLTLTGQKSAHRVCI